MGLSSVLKGAALAAPAFALAFSAANANAQSLQIDQCYPTKVALQLLAKDQQMQIARGAENDGAYTARRYWSNKDGTLGYDLKGDLPHKQEQTEVCVKDILTDIALIGRNHSTPPAFLGAKSGDGKTATDLNKAYATNSRFVLTAHTLSNKGGQLQYSNKVGILANEPTMEFNGKTGYATLERFNSSTGKSTSSYQLQDFALTQNGEQMFARQQQLRDNAPLAAVGSPVVAASLERKLTSP